MDCLSVLQTSVIWGIWRHSPCGLCWYLIAPSELSRRARHIMPDVLATFITGNVFNTDTRTFLLISLPRHSQAPTERQDTSIVRQGYETVPLYKRGLKDRPDLWIFNPWESYSYQQRTLQMMWINISEEPSYLSVIQTFVIWVICRHSPCGLCWYLIATSELFQAVESIKRPQKNE